jgi:hypothetical protein
MAPLRARDLSFFTKNKAISCALALRLLFCSSRVACGPVVRTAQIVVTRDCCNRIFSVYPHQSPLLDSD